MRQDCLKHALTIEEHFIVPKTKDLPAPARQIGVSRVVATAFGMLETVSLDDQLSADAKKVDNIRSHRNLPAKLDPIQPTIAQKTPKAKLGVGGRGAHRSRARSLTAGDAFVRLHRSAIGGEALIRRAFGASTFPQWGTGFRRRRLAQPFSPREKVDARSAAG
jgi:hypothetical protein